MAAVKSTFTKSRGKAKANIRYIQHRPGKEREKITRELFGFDGSIERKDVYTMIDNAKRETHFYRISLNPDPKWEDNKRDLDLKTLTREAMRSLEKRLGKPLEFVASIHADHTERRHVNLLAFISRKLDIPDLNFLRKELTVEARQQRRELDRILGIHWERTYQPSRKLRLRLGKLIQGRSIRQRQAGARAGRPYAPKKYHSKYPCRICGVLNCVLHKRIKGLELTLERKKKQ